MRNFYKIMAMAVVAMAATVFTGCSSDDDFMMDPMDSETLQTRAVTATRVVNFDNATEGELAGPTSYGDNLYDGSIFGWTDPTIGFWTEFNTVSGVTAFYCGGIAPSDWREHPFQWNHALPRLVVLLSEPV